MKRKGLNSIIGIPLIFILFTSCGQTVPAEKFIFDSKFDSLYKAVSYRDTMFFENGQNRIDTFVLTKIDSSLVNKIDCFMCPRAAKSVFRKYKQYPINYWADSIYENQSTDKEKVIGREVSLVSMTKFPDVNITRVYISFKNFHSSIEGSLGQPSNDSLKINGLYFTNYYILNSTAQSLIVNDEDVEIVFVTLKDGIIAYKEKSGILRKRLL